MDPQDDTQVPQPAPEPSVPEPPPAISAEPVSAVRPPAPQVIPQPSVPAAPAAAPPLGPTSPEAMQIQNTMRKKILRIILILSAVSFISVILIFLASTLTDQSLSDTEAAENTRATYQVPAGWAEDTSTVGSLYINGDSAATSQANLAVVAPTRASFADTQISEERIEAFIREYQAIYNDEEVSLQLKNRREIERPGFVRSFEFDISGVASDGTTEVIGLARLMFDENNYIHTIEFIATNNYWNSNQPDIIAILDSYRLKETP